MRFRSFPGMLVAVLLSLCPCVSPVRAEDDLPALIKKITPGVVLIHTYDNNGKPYCQGSGFFIDDAGSLITNRHVLEGAARAEVKTSTGQVYPITTVIAENATADLIQVRVTQPGLVTTGLPTSTTTPEVGSTVLTLGNPLGLELSVSDGIVSSIRVYPPHGTVYQITAPVSAGSSGSPVINTKGEVVGVAVAQVVEGQNLNFAIPASQIRALQPGRPLTFAEWTAKVYQEWLATPAGLCYSGQVQMGKRDFSGALPYFAQALKVDPSCFEAVLCMGNCYVELKRYPEAINALRQAIALAPDNADAYNNLGAAYLAQGLLQEALREINRAISLDPGNARAYINQGLVYRAQKRWDDALTSLKIATLVQPGDALAHYQLGLLYALFGDETGMRQTYQTLRKLDEGLAKQLWDYCYRR